MSMNKHIEFMTQCLSLGRIALKNGDSPVGSLIVSGDQVIGNGIEAGHSKKNITHHAELLAVKDALIDHSPSTLRNSVLYTTHEPCIMCSYVIRHYGIGTIVYGLDSNFIGGITSEFKVLTSESVPAWGNAPRIIPNVLRKECEALSEAYKNLLKKQQQ